MVIEAETCTGTEKCVRESVCKKIVFRHDFAVENTKTAWESLLRGLGDGISGPSRQMRSTERRPKEYDSLMKLIALRWGYRPQRRIGQAG